MDLRSQIESDITEALRSKDEARVSVLRLLKSAIHNGEIASGKEFSDAEIEQAIGKEIKQRRDSIESYTTGGREDLAAKEKSELDILSKYMPEQMPREELAKIVDAAVSEMGASPAQMGQIIGKVRSQVGNRAEGSLIAELVKERLGSG
jgi:uncharacterized protein YqeY